MPDTKPSQAQGTTAAIAAAAAGAGVVVGKLIS
jgi:hypothetical protein